MFRQKRRGHATIHRWFSSIASKTARCTCQSKFQTIYHRNVESWKMICHKTSDKVLLAFLWANHSFVEHISERILNIGRLWPDAVKYGNISVTVSKCNFQSPVLSALINCSISDTWSKFWSQNCLVPFLLFKCTFAVSKAHSIAVHFRCSVFESISLASAPLCNDKTSSDDSKDFSCGTSFCIIATKAALVRICALTALAKACPF